MLSIYHLSTTVSYSSVSIYIYINQKKINQYIPFIMLMLMQRLASTSRKKIIKQKLGKGETPPEDSATVVPRTCKLAC